MTQEFGIPELVSALLAVALEMIPGLQDWWDRTFTPRQKQIAIGATVMIVAVVFTLAQVASGNFTGDVGAAIWQIVKDFLLGFVVSQGVHRGVRKPI